VSAAAGSARRLTRRFVVIGQKASASGDFLASDVAGTSGRLDVLLRCVRAALLWSHGIRSDVVVYLVLGGGPRAPRVVRIDGAAARFIRPDEKSLATLATKVLAGHGDEASPGFVEFRAGIAVAKGGLEVVFDDLNHASLCVLDEAAADIRDVPDVAFDDVAFFLGDHLGFEEAHRGWLEGREARTVAVGPRSLHAEDAIAVVLNEIDRRDARRRLIPSTPVS
jgi:tRNA (pseudouridine54-N1)-methyltransferase